MGRIIEVLKKEILSLSEKKVIENIKENSFTSSLDSAQWPRANFPLVKRSSFHGWIHDDSYMEIPKGQSHADYAFKNNKSKPLTKDNSNKCDYDLAESAINEYGWIRISSHMNYTCRQLDDLIKVSRFLEENMESYSNNDVINVEILNPRKSYSFSIEEFVQNGFEIK